MKYTLRTRESGKSRGMVITRRDRRNLERVARWYSLTIDHMARMELGWPAWATMLSNSEVPTGGDLAPMPNGSPGQRASTYYATISRRMSLLSSLSVPGYDEGLVTRLDSWEPGEKTSGWWLTKAGKEYLQAPYAIATKPATLKAQHTWDSADLGNQLETMFGLDVLSEREMMAGQTYRDGETREVPVTLFQSRRRGGGPNGALPRSKRPDLALLHYDERGRVSFTAIEVERVGSRPMKEYRDKLLTYMDDPHVDAVWYLCDRNSIRNRVRQAMNDLIHAGEVTNPSQTPLLVDTVQHWGQPTKQMRDDNFARRNTSWVGLPGIGLDGSVLLNSEGQPSNVGQRTLRMIRTEQQAQDVPMTPGRSA